ncbi:uncharacterized protein LOC141731120 [Zonotrichia albicollis]|uniref:uncharacterized protein LOC141731120 n=1 Tax=Zonotrichia albicollis TaxID=44394 RepID=UPI003D80E17B
MAEGIRREDVASTYKLTLGKSLPRHLSSPPDSPAPHSPRSAEDRNPTGGGGGCGSQPQARAAAAPSGPRALRASRPPQERPRGPWPAASGCGATRSLARRTLTGAGAVRGDQRSAAEVISAAWREARDLGCERCAPAAEPPLRRARPPFPASLANAGRARSRLEPSVARRLPRPLAGAAAQAQPRRGKPAGSPRPLQGALRPVRLGGWGRAPPPCRPPGIAPPHGCRFSLSVRLPSQRARRPPGEPPHECQVRQREDRGCQGAKASCGTDPPQSIQWELNKYWVLLMQHKKRSIARKLLDQPVTKYN